MIPQFKTKNIILGVFRELPSRKFFLIWFLIGLSASVNVYGPYFFKTLIERLNNYQLNENYILYLSVTYGLILVSSKIFDDIKLSILGRLDTDISSILTIEFLNSVLRSENESESEKNTGKLIHALEKINGAIKDVIYNCFIQLIPIIVEIIVVCFVIFFNFKTKYICCFLGMILCYAFLNILITRWSLKIQHLCLSNSFSLFNTLSRVVRGRQFISLYNAQVYSSEYCKTKFNKYQKSTVQFIDRVSIGGMFYSINQLIFFTIIITIAFFDVYYKNISIGDFILINYYSSYFVKPMQSFANTYANIRKSWFDLCNILIEHMHISPYDYNSPQKELSLDKQNKAIIIKNIVFKGESKESILSSINLVIPCEKNIAFVGHSGAGKTTLARIIIKQLTPEMGEVFFGLQNIKYINNDVLRDAFLLIPQHPYLVFDTLLENLQMVNPEATMDDIKRALKLACLPWMINSKAWTHRICGNESALSGGEQQRFHIAQAFLKKAEVYIWDEPTSQLDYKIKDEIVDNIFAEFKGKTNIFITHDISIAKRCDKIFLFENGQIIGSGSHHALYASSRAYRDFFKGENI